MSLDDAGRARARAVSDAIQEYVATRPDLASSVVGMGLDAASSAIRSKPDETIDQLGPWLALVVDAFNYITTGAIGATLADMLPELGSSSAG